MKRVLQLLALLLLSTTAVAKDEETVQGEYHMLVPGYMTPDEARAAAIEQAKIVALADRFGTIVSQANILLMDQENERTNNSFYSIGQSEVRGEWIRTTYEKVEQEIKDGQLWLTARVKGKGRRVSFAKVDFETHLLRNGSGDEHEAEDFRDGDTFYLSFRSNAPGYLAVYLLDADRNATPIVPDPGLEQFTVKRGKRYVFSDDDERPFMLYTDRPQELNQVYVVFSPNKFYVPNTDGEASGPSLDKYSTKRKYEHQPYVAYKNFQKWVTRLRSNDPEVQVVTRYIKIIGKE